MVYSSRSRAAAWLAAAILIGRIGTAAASVDDRCAAINPGAYVTSDTRLVSARDIATIRDIGPTGGLPMGQTPLSLSPDRHSAAFVLTRADPDNNGYCQAVVVVDLRAGGGARMIDEGGDLVRVTFQAELRGLVTETGIPAINTPRWSPDGSRLAYLRRDKGRTQAWVADAGGTSGRPVSHSLVDVEALAWSDDGRSLVYADRISRIDEEAKLDREGLGGYLFDDRFVPVSGSRPMVSGPLPLHYAAVDMASGVDREATAAERRTLDRFEPGNLMGSPLSTTSQHGQKAWLEAAKSDRYMEPLRLWAQDRVGRKWVCDHSSCADAIIGLWWSEKQHAVRFLHREGFGGSKLAFYIWRPGKSAPRQTLVTDGLITGCLAEQDDLICLQESSSEPRRVVRLNAEAGKSVTLFDPNPEFRTLKLGEVQRLLWKNPMGFETFGDLVLPPNRKTGEKLPMIVVQYRTRGFLRGGTGDEYPIHALAAAGFAVLSVESPPSFASHLPQGEWRTWKDAEAENVKGWRERINVASSVVAGVKTAEGLGLIDASRIGLTGLSDGSTTAWYLLINTDLFAATSVSTCCADPKTDLILGGPIWEKERRRFGYPAPTDMAPDFWAPVSPALNAARIKSPVLMQLASDEYLRGLEAFTAFREIGPPAEMFVFPGDHHIKWQSAHRLAAYQRNIDWFNFWLRGKEDSDPAKLSQYERWRHLREKQFVRAAKASQ